MKVNHKRPPRRNNPTVSPSESITTNTTTKTPHRRRQIPIPSFGIPPSSSGNSSTRKRRSSSSSSSTRSSDVLVVDDDANLSNKDSSSSSCYLTQQHLTPLLQLEASLQIQMTRNSKSTLTFSPSTFVRSLAAPALASSLSSLVPNLEWKNEHEENENEHDLYHHLSFEQQCVVLYCVIGSPTLISKSKDGLQVSRTKLGMRRQMVKEQFGKWRDMDQRLVEKEVQDWCTFFATHAAKPPSSRIRTASTATTKTTPPSNAHSSASHSTTVESYIRPGMTLEQRVRARAEHSKDVLPVLSGTKRPRKEESGKNGELLSLADAIRWHIQQRGRLSGRNNGGIATRPWEMVSYAHLVNQLGTRWKQPSLGLRELVEELCRLVPEWIQWVEKDDRRIVLQEGDLGGITQRRKRNMLALSSKVSFSTVRERLGAVVYSMEGTVGASLKKARVSSNDALEEEKVESTAMAASKDHPALMVPTTTTFVSSSQGPKSTSVSPTPELNPTESSRRSKLSFIDRRKTKGVPIRRPPEFSNPAIPSRRSKLSLTNRRKKKGFPIRLPTEGQRNISTQESFPVSHSTTTSIASKTNAPPCQITPQSNPKDVGRGISYSVPSSPGELSHNSSNSDLLRVNYHQHLIEADFHGGDVISTNATNPRGLKLMLSKLNAGQRI